MLGKKPAIEGNAENSNVFNLFGDQQWSEAAAGVRGG